MSCFYQTSRPTPNPECCPQSCRHSGVARISVFVFLPRRQRKVSATSRAASRLPRLHCGNPCTAKRSHSCVFPLPPSCLHRPSSFSRPSPRSPRWPRRRSRPTATRSPSPPAATSGPRPPPAAKPTCSSPIPPKKPRPLYSPDGTRLAFQSTRTGANDIYILTFATGALQRITYTDAAVTLDAWSRDGQWLYFTSSANDVAGQGDIFRVHATGGTPLEVSRERYLAEFESTPRPTASRVVLVAKGISGSQWWRNGHAHIDETELWLKPIDGASLQAARPRRRQARLAHVRRPTARPSTS